MSRRKAVSGSWLRGVVGVLGLATVLGCTQGDERTPLSLEVAQTLRDSLRRKDPPPPLVLTRALLDTVPVPQLELIYEQTDDRNFLVLHVVTSDDLAGRVEVWRNPGDQTFTFRDGMLISTRGLPEILLSGQVPAVRDGRAGPGRDGARTYVYRAGDFESANVRLACSVADQGAQQLEIVEQQYPVHHLRETCIEEQGASGPSGKIVNDYWIDSRDGRLWQSRQWLGPKTGYIQTRLLHFGLGDRRDPALMHGE